MKNKKLRAIMLAVFAVLLLAPGYFAVHASTGFLITEIMYDPQGADSNREWIEIYNTSTSATNIEDHILLTDGLSSAKHAISAVSTSSIEPGAYAVIVQNTSSFMADNPNFTGLLFDSSWTGLTASAGKMIVLTDAESNVLAQVTYDPTLGASNDGNSLQLTASSNWVSSLPTPGASNGGESAGTGDTEDDTDTDTTADDSDTGAKKSSSSPVPKKIPDIPRMQASLSLPRMAISGTAIPIAVTAYGPSGELLTHGSFHYAFGDGTAHDSPSSESFHHVYTDPGSYVISLEYRPNVYVREPLIRARTTVEVIDSPVAIAKVSPNGSIELKSAGNADTDLSGWILRSFSVPDEDPFSFPSGTVLLAGKKITVPGRATGLFGEALQSIGLMLPSGVVSMVYGDPPATVEIPSIVRQVSQSFQVESNANKSVAPVTVIPTPEKQEMLPATAVLALSETADATSEEKSRSVLPFVAGLAGLLVVAVVVISKLNAFSPKQPTDEDAAHSETKQIAEEIRIVE